MWQKVKKYPENGEVAGGKPVFSETAQQELRDVMSRYPTNTAATLPALHLAQKEFGFVDDGILEALADLMDLSPMHLKETHSFYTLFRARDTGKYLIQVCHTISCALCGAKSVVGYLQEKLGIQPGETTPDGKFTLTKVECLGSCGTAPMMQINDTYFEGLTKRKIDEILAKLD